MGIISLLLSYCESCLYPFLYAYLRIKDINANMLNIYTIKIHHQDFILVMVISVSLCPKIFSVQDITSRLSNKYLSLVNRISFMISFFMPTIKSYMINPNYHDQKSLYLFLS
jgi:hypothetical protein